MVAMARRSRLPPLEPRPTPGVAMPTILIVDDEQHIRLLIEQTLEELEDEGVQLLTASDGEEALDVVAIHHPELVFLDVMMPKKNGFEVCEAIKHERGMSATKVVLLTAKGQAVDRERGMAAGADRYMTKPFDPDVLLATARELLGSGA
jgi:two-component system, OmpR family, alkaline phosphatase synthesis response regulator PhoP